MTIERAESEELGAPAERLPQNSAGTRERYALSVLRWFFPDVPSGLSVQVWKAYENESIERDVLRVLYLRAEPLVGSPLSFPRRRRYTSSCTTSSLPTNRAPSS